MKKALITGITGFVGSHLAELLLSEGYDVSGIVRWRSRTENIEHIRDRLQLVHADLKDPHSLELALKETRPDFIFHLAAQSFVPASWRAPADTMDTNVIGTVHLYESIRKTGSDPVIQVACSSEEYGLVFENELPITENNPLRPLSPYGVSKVTQDRLSYQYFKSYGLKIIITRAFNHTGPRRGEVFATSNFAKQIAEIEKGKKAPVIHVGNLDAKRDFTDVRDIVKAYLLAVLKGKPGEVYNLCTEKTYTMKAVIDILLKESKINIEIRQDPSRMRPSDVLVLMGNSSKFREATGWKPEIPFEQTAVDLLNYWRERV